MEMQVSEDVDAAAAACAMSESVKLPESWGISARELCDHFAAWVRGELPVVGDVRVDVRLPTTFQRNTIIDDGAAGYLVGINATVRDAGSAVLAGALHRWRGGVWEASRLEGKLMASSFGLTSRAGGRFAVELVSAAGLYVRNVHQVGAVIVLLVNHIPRPLVPVVERRQQLGGGRFDDIQHALGKMEGRR